MKRQIKPLRIAFRKASFYALLVFTRIVRELPRPAIMAAARVAGRLFHLLSSRYKSTARRQLRIAFPNRSDGEIRTLARRVFENMGMSFFEFLIYAYQSGRFSWPYLDTSEADAKIKSILSHKNNRAGVIFLTAHYGAYELLGSYLSRNFGTVIITQKLHLPALNNLVHEWRLRIGFKYVDNSETMKIMRVLKSGGSLAILPDLDLPRFRKINVDFFRRPVELTVGPSTLALRAGALIVPLFIERTRCGYFIRVYDAVDFKPSGDTEKDYLALTNKWVAVFEEQLSRRPEEWVWWGERWKDDSPG